MLQQAPEQSRHESLRVCVRGMFMLQCPEFMRIGEAEIASGRRGLTFVRVSWVPIPELRCQYRSNGLGVQV